MRSLKAGIPRTTILYNRNTDKYVKNNMAELKIICEYPDSLKQFIEEALSKRIASLKDGIRRTEERINEFEGKYQMSTEEFLRRFETDELQHRLDMEFDEWVGESRMLKGLQKEAGNLRGIEFVN